MATFKPFAYNPSQTPISGTNQIGDLAIGTTSQDYSARPGGVTWWMGPDEDSGYVICAPVSAGNYSTPVGNVGTVEFWRSTDLTDNSFISLVNSISGNNYSTTVDAGNWVTTNNYYTNFITSTEGKYVLATNYNASTNPYLSTDYGATFNTISAGTNSNRATAMSDRGQYMLVTSSQSSDNDYKSSNYGVGWSGFTAGVNLTPFGAAISDSGQYQTIADYNGRLYVSTNYGVDWLAKGSASSLNYVGCAMSGNGQYQSSVVSVSGQIWVSSDNGSNWAAKGSTLSWTGIAVSQSGQYQTASVNNVNIFISNDYGLTWTGKTCNGNKLGVGMSQSGQYQITGAYNNGYLWRSTDYGQNWTELTGQTLGYWAGFSVSGTGKYQYACTDTYIYKSSDYGVNWSQTTAPSSTGNSRGGWYNISTNRV